MGYLSPHALQNLTRYKYQGIDKCVYPMTFPLASRSGFLRALLTRVVVATQIYIIKLRAEPVLELASRAMAEMGRSEHCKRVLVAGGAAYPPLNSFDRSRFAGSCSSCSTLRRCSITTRGT